MQAEFLLDGLEHDGQDLPVDVVENVDDEQQPDDVVAVGIAGTEFCGRAGIARAHGLDPLTAFDASVAMPSPC